MPSIQSPVELSPHLYIVYSEFPHRDSSNIYLITGAYPTLIDCGSHRAIPRLISNLAQLGIAPRDIVHIIATHGDYDHIQGFHDLRVDHPDLRLHVHPLDWPSVQGSDPYRTCSYVYHQPFVPIVADQCLALEDGERISTGDTELTVHHTPGHTEGSVSLLGEIDGHKVLFAGDAIGGAMRSLDGADLESWAQAMVTWKRSLTHLETLEFEWILNGHEPARSLPISRSFFNRSVTSFGTMLNPWFLLDEPAAEPDSTTLPAGLPVPAGGVSS
jgi:glyoxylase-like metal-dependent hydrolase (beta-lactamase superfamily II)